MEITIKGTPKEIADLVTQLQSQQTIDIHYEQKNLLGEAFNSCLDDELTKIEETKNGNRKPAV